MQDLTHISLSISVVSYNSADEQLRSLLSSLLASLQLLKSSIDLSAVTITLVDNSDHHRIDLDIFSAFQAELDLLGADLSLTQGQGNVGYGSAHNLAIKKSEADFHLLLNSDVVIKDNCLSAGITYLVNNPEVAVASPYTENECGQKQYLCKRYPSVFTFFIRGFLPATLRKLFSKRLARFEMHELSEQSPKDSVPIVSGCFMLCRTDKLKAVGGFDENYFLYFEDFDLSLRLGRVGKLAYLPEMKIQHGGGHSTNKGLAHIMMFVRSGRRFFTTHGWQFLRQR